jgi:adenosylhomocysteinase
MIALRKRLNEEQPLLEHRIVGSSHVTKETAVLIRTLEAAGAQVAWCASNPLTTQEHVAAALAAGGTQVFAWRGMSTRDYYRAIERAITSLPPGPTLCLDDGGDLIITLHQKFSTLAGKVYGGTDKTTTGVERVRALAEVGRLLFPIIAVNDAAIKWEVDNVYGTGQSTIDGILRSICILLAGKTFVVAGYGHVGRGVALRARGMGSHVVITEVRATSALKASLEGFRVMSMDEAAKVGDLFCTATGMKDVIVGRHLDVMKNGVILCNAGHFDCELNLNDLEARTQSKREVRPSTEEYQLNDGRRLYLLGKGRVINLAAAEGNPSEVMDLTFAAQSLALLKLATSAGSLDARVHKFPGEQDEEVARLKLQAMGVATDRWTEEQSHYALDPSS